MVPPFLLCAVIAVGHWSNFVTADFHVKGIDFKLTAIV